MARISQVAPVLSRDALRADRPGPASASPFRSTKYATRVKAARAMITKREQEIVALEAELDNADTPKLQRILSQRLLASRNNLRSWQDYIANAERVAGAVIIPPKSR